MITDHNTSGQAPSQLLMNRGIRNNLDLILPDFQTEQNYNGWKQVERHRKVQHFEESNPVLVRSYNTPNKWTPGIVNKPLGQMHYEVNVDGKVSKRHIDQLRPHIENASNIEPPVDVTDDPPPISQSNSMHEPVEPPDRSIVLPPRCSRGVPPLKLTCKLYSTLIIFLPF